MLKSDRIDVSAPSKNGKWLLLAACLILIILIPLFCFSPDGDPDDFFTRSRLFWFHIIWFECIFLMLWYGSAGRHVSKLVGQRQQTGGANMALAHLWYELAFCSFIFWGASIFIPAGAKWQAIPLLLQGAAIMVFLPAFFVTPWTKKLQMQGIEPLPGDLPLPAILAEQLLENIRKDYSGEEKNEMRRIAEKIRYSLPQAGKIGSSRKYRELVEFIRTLNASADAGSLPDSLRNISTLVNQLSLECKQ